MKKFPWLVALFISSSFVGLVAADGAKPAPTRDQDFLRGLARQPETLLLETLFAGPPKVVDHCYQTICKFSYECVPPVCDIGAFCYNSGAGYKTCAYY